MRLSDNEIEIASYKSRSGDVLVITNRRLIVDSATGEASYPISTITSVRTESRASWRMIATGVVLMTGAVLMYSGPGRTLPFSLYRLAFVPALAGIVLALVGYLGYTRSVITFVAGKWQEQFIGQKNDTVVKFLNAISSQFK